MLRCCAIIVLVPMQVTYAMLYPFHTCAAQQQSLQHPAGPPCLPACLIMPALPYLPTPLQAQCGGAGRGCAAGPALSSA